MPATPLWIISELYYPELTSTGYYITAIAEHLAGDADVRVICGQPNYSARGKIAPRRATRNQVSITRVGGMRLSKNVLLFRMLNMLGLCTSIFLKAVGRFQRGDKVLVVTTPPLLPFFTSIAALVKGAGYTLLVHDLYPEQLYATGILEKGSLVAKVIDLLNRWVYKHAGSIVAVGRDMKQLLEAKTDGLDIPVIYVPNWGETNEIVPEARDTNPLLKNLGLEDKFVILCAGNLGRPNDLETIVTAAGLLSTNDRVRFLFIGDGAKEAWLKERASKLSNIQWLSPMPRADQQVFLNACDLTIASLVTGMWGAAVPSRIYNYLAAGKPIVGVCEPASEIARTIEDDGAGVRVTPGDAAALASEILRLMDSPELLSGMSAKAREAALRKYSAKAVLPKYSKVLIGTE